MEAKKMRREKIVTKTFLAKKPNGTKKMITIKYNREELAAPIYLVRSD